MEVVCVPLTYQVILPLPCEIGDNFSVTDKKKKSSAIVGQARLSYIVYLTHSVVAFLWGGEGGSCDSQRGCALLAEGVASWHGYNTFKRSKSPYMHPHLTNKHSRTCST